jgi:parallel beta-helix repeat protein
MDPFKRQSVAVVVCLGALWVAVGAPRPLAGPVEVPLQAAFPGGARVDCDREPQGALQRAIDRARPGEEITIAGTCQENVEIPAGKDAITLDGGGSGAINGADPLVNTLQIRGPRAVRVTGLTITGGRAGIDVSRGATAIIDHNIIEGTSRNGITLGAFAAANIADNIIQNNASAGILVTGNAFGFIGFTSADDTSARPNVIRNNGTHGISLTLSSSARIAGNTISGNLRHGVNVERASQATISDNTIEANGQHGIFITENSVANLGSDTGTGLFDAPNRTNANNTLRGVACRVGGSANGRRGTLNGTAGPTDFGTSCVDSLDVPDGF